jgi:hypothetical protein
MILLVRTNQIILIGQILTDLQVMKHLRKLLVSQPKILKLQTRGFFHRNREIYFIYSSFISKEE